MSTNAENLMKISLVHAEIFLGYVDFCHLVQKGAVVILAISGVIGLILIIFAHDVGTISSFNIFESKLPYSYPFQNARLPNEGHFANLAQNLVAIATSFEVQINHIHTDTYHLVKKK